MARNYRGTIDYSYESSLSAAKRRKFDSALAALYPCLVCNEPFRRRGDLWDHLTVKEEGTNVFVCLNCRRGYCKERLLREHECEAKDDDDDEYASAARRSVLSAFCHLIACEECGLFVPLLNIENPGWKSYASLCSHPSRSFRKITLYVWTPDAVRFIRSDLMSPLTIRIDFGPAVTKCVPLACELCMQLYRDVDEIEKHVVQNHRGQVRSKQCQHCSCKFSSSLRMDIHVSEKHGRGRWDLLDFVKSVSVGKPYIDKTMNRERDSFYPCDLCNHDYLGSKFNEHDCAINFTRRYLLNGKVVRCPAAQLEKVKIDMSIQDPMMLSLSEKIQRGVDLCMRFTMPVVAPKIDDFKDDQVFSCKHCERVIISPTLFREHVLEAFHEQQVEFDWPRFDDVSRPDVLLHFGIRVKITEAGFACPKRGCATIWCSTVGLEQHLRHAHEYSFELLTVPDFMLEEDDNNGGGGGAPLMGGKKGQPIACPICREQGFRGKEDMTAHIRDCHLHPCGACGNCYVNSKRLDYHKRSSVSCNVKNANAPLAFCPLCKAPYQQLSDYYTHLVVDHPESATHDDIMGQMLPKCHFFLQVATDRRRPSAELLPPPPLVKKEEFGNNANEKTKPMATGVPTVIPPPSNNLIGLRLVSTSTIGGVTNVIATVTSSNPMSNLVGIRFPSISSIPTAIAANANRNIFANSTTTIGSIPVINSTNQIAPPTPPIASVSSSQGGTSTSADDSDVQLDQGTPTNPKSEPKTTSSSMNGVGTNKGDDEELMIVDPDPDMPSTSGREPTHPCEHCSMKFFTQRAADEHRKTHEFDAGVETTEVLPVPNNMNVYVCRLCCHAYEEYATFQEHMQRHRKIVDCPECCALCLNPTYLKTHVESHKSGAIAFGCPSCFLAYRSEVTLMIHMHQTHQFPVLWMCQRCGKANSNWNQMAGHTCQENISANPIDQEPSSYVVPTPKRKLHFQPRRSSNIADYRRIANMDDVAECVHRSFLGGKEAGIACPRCGTSVPCSTYTATVLDKSKLHGQIRLSLTDETTERHLFYSHPCSRRMKQSIVNNLSPLPTATTAAMNKLHQPGAKMAMQQRTIAPRPPPPVLQRLLAPPPPPQAPPQLQRSTPMMHHQQQLRGATVPPLQAHPAPNFNPFTPIMPNTYRLAPMPAPTIQPPPPLRAYRFQNHMNIQQQNPRR